MLADNDMVYNVQCSAVVSSVVRSVYYNAVQAYRQCIDSTL